VVTSLTLSSKVMNARNGPRRDMRVIKGGKLVCYELSLSLSIYLARMAWDVELQLSALSVGG
jgi:hypothetical protein